MNTLEQRYEKLFKSCKIGDIDTIKNLILFCSNPLDLTYNDNEALKIACSYEQKEVISYFFSQDHYSVTPNLNEDFCLHLIENHKNADFLKFIFVNIGIDDNRIVNQALLNRSDTSSFVKEREAFLNQIHLHILLKDACKKGDINNVHHLLSLENDNYPLDVGYSDQLPLKMAGHYGHTEIVQYLLSSPKLKQHANIYYNNYEALKFIFSGGHQDVFKYIMIDYDMKVDENIMKDFISCCPELMSLYSKRELEKTLRKELTPATKKLKL